MNGLLLAGMLIVFQNCGFRAGETGIQNPLQTVAPSAFTEKSFSQADATAANGPCPNNFGPNGLGEPRLDIIFYKSDARPAAEVQAQSPKYLVHCVEVMYDSSGWHAVAGVNAAGAPFVFEFPVLNSSQNVSIRAISSGYSGTIENYSVSRTSRDGANFFVHAHPLNADIRFQLQTSTDYGYSSLYGGQVYSLVGGFYDGPFRGRTISISVAGGACASEIAKVHLESGTKQHAPFPTVVFQPGNISCNLNTNTCGVTVSSCQVE